MPILTNKYTKQPPIAGASTAAVMAERVYIAAFSTNYTAPTARLDGADPAAPWAAGDLGVIKDSRVNLNYTKEIKYVETGIEKVRRGAYSLSKTVEMSFMMEQSDVGPVSLLTGLAITTSWTSIPANGASLLHVGQDDVVEKGLLFIGTNKSDGKEHHIWC